MAQLVKTSKDQTEKNKKKLRIIFTADRVVGILQLLVTIYIAYKISVP